MDDDRESEGGGPAEGFGDIAGWRFFIVCRERSSLSSAVRFWYSCKTSLPMLGDSEYISVMMAMVSALPRERKHDQGVKVWKIGRECQRARRKNDDM